MSDDAQAPSVQELVDKVYMAFSLISKMAQAELIMLERIASLEDRVAQLEAQAAIRKAGKS